MKIGVFLPIGNNGWIISTTSPQYLPTFELNSEIARKAESFGFEFALSMIKLRGFGGKSRYWDFNLESFTLMAGIAAVTSRIQLFATVPVLTIPPAIAARMAVTIDSISKGRFGVNIVSGWQRAEYDQMGIWPGDDYFDKRYEYCAEYVTILKELWATGRSNFKGEFFQMEDCRVEPQPIAPVKLIAAAQSDRGTRFAAEFCDYNFCASMGVNQPTAFAPSVARLVNEVEKAQRKVEAIVLVMIIADETDEAANAKWEHYKSGVDLEALGWRDQQAKQDPSSDPFSTPNRRQLGDVKSPVRGGVLVGSYEKVAGMLDEMSTVVGVEGILLTFDDFLIGVEQFGRRIQPLMKSRAHIVQEKS